MRKVSPAYKKSLSCTSHLSAHYKLVYKELYIYSWIVDQKGVVNLAFSWSIARYLKELALCNYLGGGFKAYYFHPKVFFFHGIKFCVFIIFFLCKKKIYITYSPVLASKSWRLLLSSLGSVWVLLLTSEGTGLDFNTTSGASSSFTC